MSRRAAWAVAGLLAVLAVGVLRFEAGSAATIEARWELFGRADAASFAPGGTPIDGPGTGAGYEIVSFAAAGPSTALDTYMYGGADLPGAHGGPMPPLVSCESSFTATELFLDVQGAYPFAGCVFFIGVSNTGEEPVRVHLGMFDEHAMVTCNAPGCERSDIELMAGGPDASSALAACNVQGETVELADDVLALAPGSRLVCPVFVVVLQPAAEGAIYTLVIEPPPLTTTTTTVQTFDPGTDQVPAGPPPGNVEVPIDEEPSAEPETPTEAVEGERTRGPEPTPAPPDTGSGMLVQRERESGTAWIAVFMLGAACVVLAVGLRQSGHRR